MKALTIGKLAAASGIGVENLRFYEREGLLPEPPRTASGYRVYPAEAVDRLRFIRRAKSLGFSLAEIRQLLSLQDGSGSRAQVRAITRTHLADVEEKIRDLERIRDVLGELETCCSGRGPVKTCPIIRALADEHSSLTEQLP